MSQTIRKLSVVDSAFLFAETAECPMHVGTLAIVRPEPERASAFFDDITSLFAARVRF